MTLLAVKGLRTGFKIGEQVYHAVDDVSFSLKTGQFVCIVGESGCGKSVLSLSIMNLLPRENGKITSGEILLDGKNLIPLTDEEMNKIRGKDIAMIFQEPMTALNPVFSIGFQIAEILHNHTKLTKPQIRSKSIELLRQVGIPRPEKILEEYPHQLSGGMRQRVMIAMAIACSPKLLIADEPTTALDVTIQAQILELMKEIQQKRDVRAVDHARSRRGCRDGRRSDRDVCRTNCRTRKCRTNIPQPKAPLSRCTPQLYSQTR